MTSFVTANYGQDTKQVLDPNTDSYSVGDLTPYLGQVSTNTFVPNTLNAGFTYGYCRNPHFARDNLTEFQIVLPNWYAISQSGDATNAGGVTSYTASIEYPIGVLTQVLFSGDEIGKISSIGNIISDLISLNIPNGEKFWTRIWVNAPGGLMYFNYYQPDGTAQSDFGNTVIETPDLTMGGSAAVTTGLNKISICPVAIIARTTKKSLAIIGDSIAVGQADSVNASCRQGYLAKAFGAKFAYGNVGVSGDTLTGFLAGGSAQRRALINSYFSHVISQYGINDCAIGRTAAQIMANMNTFVALFPTKQIAVCTLTPRTTGTWADTTGQTVTAIEAVRVTVNAEIRNGNLVAPIHAVFDPERAAESSYLSGLWQSITGTITPAVPGYTADGIHPNITGTSAIAASLNSSLFM